MDTQVTFRNAKHVVAFALLKVFVVQQVMDDATPWTALLLKSVHHLIPNYSHKVAVM